MLELLSEARRTATACAAAPLWTVPDRDLPACLVQAWATMQQLTATMAHLIHQTDTRELPKAHGASSTVVWLRQLVRTRPGVGKRLVKLAEALDARPGLDDAMSAGLISDEQVMSIKTMLDDLPTSLGREVIDEAESALLDLARQFDSLGLARLADRALVHLGSEVAEHREQAFLDRQEKAYGKRGFTMSPIGDGRVRLSGFLDAVGAATVRAALDPLCHPRRDDAAGPRTPAQRRADALVDICAGALRGDVDLPRHGGDATQVVVTVPFTTLTDRLGAADQFRAEAAARPDTGPNGGAGYRAAAAGAAGAAGDAGDGDGAVPANAADPRPGAGVGWLDTGAPISASEARLLACDARIIPAVLGGDSQPLDLGRSRRLFTGPVRRALILRDGGCSFPGCDRPPRWTEGHHLLAWPDDGRTELANGCLVCRFHHRLLHDGSGWQVRLAPDGHPEYLPPATIDPQRRPRRNIYHRRQ